MEAKRACSMTWKFLEEQKGKRVKAFEWPKVGGTQRPAQEPFSQRSQMGETEPHSHLQPLGGSSLPKALGGPPTRTPRAVVKQAVRAERLELRITALLLGQGWVSAEHSQRLHGCGQWPMVEEAKVQSCHPTLQDPSRLNQAATRVHLSSSIPSPLLSS